MFSNEIAHCSHVGSSNVASFYKCVPLKSSNILRRVEKTYKKFQEKPLPTIFKPSLTGPPMTWKVFNHLQAAAEHAESLANVCMIFSFEERDGNAGQRKFLVAHPEYFWHNYRIRPPEEKCSYEVIRENFPCKLYFDLEYYTAFNSNKNGHDMTEIFVKCVIASMSEQHGLTLVPSDFLWLDSSNDSKFSCHLILQMKDVAFQDNTQAGTFVQILLSKLQKKMEDKSPSDALWPSWVEIQTLFVKTKKENHIIFCDQGVYTRNRNFRMYQSTKLGKKCPLLVSSHNKYVPASHLRNEEEAIFYASLITYFRNKVTKFLTYEENVQSCLLSQPKTVKNSQSGVSSCTSSPFPELDDFILKIVSDPFAVGFIRKWTHFSKEQKIIYDIGNYRYCGNIGRHHKSNNIRIVVDLMTKHYYQLCLDPECRWENYQSESRAIPSDITLITVPDDFFESVCFSQLESNENKENSGRFSVDSLESVDICGDVKLQSKIDTGHHVKACKRETLEQLDDNEYNEEMFGDWDLYSEEVGELERVNHPSSIVNGKVESHDGTHQSPLSEETSQDWDIFFRDDSTCFEIGTAHEKCEITSTKDDLGNISLEEEMLMVEVADATEATANIHEGMFSEETMF